MNKFEFHQKIKYGDLIYIEFSYEGQRKRNILTGSEFKLKGNFDKHDKLLYHRDRFEFYLCEATAELTEVRKNIHLVNEKISLIDEQINSLLAVRKAFRKESIKDRDAFILYEDVETKDFSNTFGQSNFDWIYSDGMELFINDNKKRIENYKKILKKDE